MSLAPSALATPASSGPPTPPLGAITHAHAPTLAPAPSSAPATAAAIAPSSLPLDHKSKTTNLLLARAKEKLLALQGEYAAQAKKLADSEVAHAKLQASHTALQAKLKHNDEAAAAKHAALVAQHRLEFDAMHSSLSTQHGDQLAQATGAKEHLADQLALLTAGLASAQTARQEAERSLESERARWTHAMQGTQSELLQSRKRSEEMMHSLRQEREERMKNDYALSDAQAQTEAQSFRCKRLEERLDELGNQMTQVQQARAEAETEALMWRDKLVSTVRSRSDVRTELRRFKLLLLYTTIHQWVRGWKERKALAGVQEKISNICSLVVSQKPLSMQGLLQQQQQEEEQEALERKRSQASRRASRRAGDAPLLPNVGALTGAAAAGGASGSSMAMPMSGGLGTTATATSMSLAPPSSHPPVSMSAGATRTPNPGGLTEREWEFAMTELSRRLDMPTTTSATTMVSSLGGVPAASRSNLAWMALLEERLSILAPVVAEIRLEVAAARSTSEGMFQRTLHLSRQNALLQSRLEKERSRALEAWEKLEGVQQHAHAHAHTAQQQHHHHHAMDGRKTGRRSDFGRMAGAGGGVQGGGGGIAWGDDARAEAGSRSARTRRRMSGLPASETAGGAFGNVVFNSVAAPAVSTPGIIVDFLTGEPPMPQSHEEKEASASLIAAAAATGMRNAAAGMLSSCSSSSSASSSSDDDYATDDEFEPSNSAASVAESSAQAQPQGASRTTAGKSSTVHAPVGAASSSAAVGPSGGNAAQQWETRKSRPTGRDPIVLTGAHGVTSGSKSSYSAAMVSGSYSPPRARLPAASRALGGAPLRSAGGGASAPATARLSKSSHATRTSVIPGGHHVLSRTLPSAAGGIAMHDEKQRDDAGAALAPAFCVHAAAERVASVQAQLAYMQALSSRAAGVYAPPSQRKVVRNPYAVSVRPVSRGAGAGAGGSGAPRPFSAQHEQPRPPSSQQPRTHTPATHRTQISSAMMMHTLNPAHKLEAAAPTAEVES